MVFYSGTMYRGEDPEGKLSNLNFCGIAKMFHNNQVYYNQVNYDQINRMITLTVCY